MTLRLFLPITKVDAKQGIIYGVAAVEQVDKAQEIFDYESSKPNFQKWSDTIAKTTDGKSLGNVRAMHGKVAAGKLEQLVFNDTDKQIEIAAKIVDQAELAKAIEGVYTGFSIGGSYEKRWKDGDNTRYTANPAEISLVDNPCMPDATFKMIKGDGSEELRKFTSVIATAPTNEQVAAKAVELAKAAGNEAGWSTFIEQATAALTKVETPVKEELVTDASPRQPGADLEQVWKAADGKTFAKKADAVAHNEELAKTATAPSQNLADALNGAEAALQKAEKPMEKVERPKVRPMTLALLPRADRAKLDKAAQEAELTKGLCAVARLANLINDINWLLTDVTYEAVAEKDGSSTPAALKASVTSLCEALKAMVAEETSEMLDAHDVETYGSVLAMSAPVAQLQKLLGESTPTILKGIKVTIAEQPVVAPAPVEKVVDVELQKRLDDEVAKTAALEKSINEAIPRITDLTKRLAALEAQPMPGFQGTATVVEKGAATGSSDPMDVLKEMYKNDPEQLAIAMIKIAQTNPQRAF
jgi:hypothetical protein